MPENITSHLVVPVVNEADARETAQVLDAFKFETVTVVHVIEKGGGAPDKMPLEMAERRGKEAFAAFQEVIPSAETELTYGRNVVSKIFDVASEKHATAIAFRPRSGNRVVKFLTGDKALRLVTEADRPVIALPENPDNDA